MSEEAQASALRGHIAELLERGYLHVRTFTGAAGDGNAASRLLGAKRVQKACECDGREAAVLHRESVTHVYARRPKRKETA